MNKAYDRVEWDFLEATLLKFGFSRHWVNLVMACVSTVTFSIVLNGNSGSSFRPSRGLRQGDPLSPYLFLIISEVLSLRLTKAIHVGDLVGVKLTRSCPIISHLFFVDDALLFMKATLINCWRLIMLFNEYCTTSGQLINHDKSSIFFSPNTPDQMKRLMCALLRIVGVHTPGTYLGLPTIWGKSKREALVYIKERIGRKIEGWKQSSLSQDGKEVLIKSVAMAIPSYPMACFKFPKSICDEINSAHGSVLKARYFPNCDFLKAEKGYRASWGWSSLLDARDLLFKGASWQVINGYSVNIWADNWLPPPNIRPLVTTGLVQGNAPTMVNELIDWDTHTWVLDQVLHLLHPSEVVNILTIPIGSGERDDRLLWPWNKDGRYTVKSGYHWIHSNDSFPSNSTTGSSHVINSRVWKMARCDYVYRHRQPSSSQVLCYAVSLACEILEASVHNRIGGAPLSDNINQWSPPPQNVAAINCDASWKSPSTGGLGTIIRDYRGMVICGATFNTCSGSVIIAEAQAILLGLNLAIKHNLKRVRVDSDSLEAITEIRKANSYQNWRISPIIDEIHKKSQYFDHITWEWIPREANRVAHVVASLAIRSVGLNRWANRPPPSLSMVLRNDGLPCPHGNDS
ncbi:uncharacterized protein LOC112163903 [Rosa chinensis]|uniref:uncharacterized protein LOC112163903 n=1 Tax=Rosa chinensis TaxID=74649 RepID=UPI000D08BC13|nr:uncharacterized protein LOC112163903 [Rosa chinensis]